MRNIIKQIDDWTMIEKRELLLKAQDNKFLQKFRNTNT